MDLTSLIEIVISIAVIYFFIKFIAIPVVRVILGIILFFVLVYLLQRFLGFNFSQILAPFGISLNSSKWGLNFIWFTDQIKNFLDFIWGNFIKSLNK